MKDEYKKQLNQIKAPKSLIEKTRLEMRKREEQIKQETKESDKKLMGAQKNEQPPSLPVKNHHSGFLRFAVLAAVLIIIIGAGGYGYYQSRNSLQVASVEQENDSFSVDRNFGQMNGSKNENIEVSKGSSSKVIPDFLRETKANTINDTEVWLAKDEKNVFYAGYQKDETYYFIQAKDLSEDEFLAYIKSRIE